MLRQGSFRLPHGAGDKRGKGQQNRLHSPAKGKLEGTAQGRTLLFADGKPLPLSGPVGEGFDSVDSGLDGIGAVGHCRNTLAAIELRG